MPGPVRRGPPWVSLLGSWFGLGYAPWAPGTFGSLGALPLWWAIRHLVGEPYLVHGLVTLGVIAVGVVVAGRTEMAFGKHDDGRVVIDEVAGMLVGSLGVPFAWAEVLLVFGCFRLLDIAKPGPIRWLDTNVRGGWGVMLDDLVAGAVTCLVLHALRAYVGDWL